MLIPKTLNFGIEFLDPEFFHYTEWEPAAAGMVHFISTDESEEMVIEAKTSPTMPLRPSQFVQDLPVDPTKERRELKEIRLGAIGGEMKSEPIVSSNFLKHGYRMEFEEASVGGYQVEFGFGDGSAYPDESAEPLQFFVSNTLSFQPLPAVLEWRPKESESANPSGEPPSFTLKFHPRATIWRYMIIGIPTDDLESTTIEVEGRDVKFKSFPDELWRLPNGSDALVISSEDPIPLQQLPPWKMLLRSGAAFDGLRLPTPGNDLSRGQNGETSAPFYSDIYVQL